MRGNKPFIAIVQAGLTSLSVFVLFFAPVRANAQSASSVTAQNPISGQQTVANPQTHTQNNQPTSGNIQPAPAPSAEEILKRIDRARALAAAHQLEAGASELESARAASRDVALRDAMSVILMGIYLEAGNYSRAQSLLEETFQARSTAKDSSLRSYFALAGAAVNGIRSHLSRYRSFGISVGGANLPAEAVNDLDRLRALLERMVAQAKEITKDAPKANDGLALLEDVLGIRASVARDREDRDKWQAEYAQAREQLGSGRIQIASLGRAAPLARAQPNQSQQAPARAITDSPPKQDATPPPSTSAETSQVRTMNAGLLNERASKRVTPAYPESAKAAKAEGVVKVVVIVDEKGEVQVISSEGPTFLKQAAEDAARGWRFSPFIVGGKPVRLSGYIEFKFGG